MSLRLTPDGQRYLSMAAGMPQPMPFHLRRLIPTLCGGSEARWIAVNVASILGAAVLTGILATQHGATIEQSAVAGALLLGLPWVRFCWSRPVLVDMPALALALLAAVLVPINVYACGAALVAAALTSEKAPIFASLFAWNPLLLTGLAVPVLLYLWKRPAQVDPNDPLARTLSQPLATGLSSHANAWRSAHAMLFPWGACLAVIAAPSVWVGVALLVGYAQLLVATDSVRLYQQAAPVLCISAAFVIPAGWVAAVLVAHWFSPLQGDGV